LSFLLTAALLVGVLAAVPLIAHLLQRGRTEERIFPPTALVLALPTTSEQRSRLKDRALLGLRLTMVAALAVLGATPLVRCSRLSVDRSQGASVALALVLDDSHSMRAKTPSGETRWQAAVAGARELLRSVRDGDAVAIVLAGKPARLALSATTDLGAARSALEQLAVSDRGTDLDDAVKLARSALKALRQPDQRVIVLSDLAGATLSDADVSAPLDTLTHPVNDCGIVSAHRQAGQLDLTLACSKQASGEREIRIVSDTSPDAIVSDAERARALRFSPLGGTQTLSLPLNEQAPEFRVRLEPPDDNPANDTASVARAGAELGVAVVTDATRASVVTGGANIVEQALEAVRPTLNVRPLSLLPDETQGLAGYAALVLNDPNGLAPESRAVLSEWVNKGGVVFGLLGPASSNLQLSSNLEPFAERSAHWEERTEPLDVNAASLGWLGPEAQGLGALSHGGRMRLDGALLPGTEQIGAWSDGVPFLLRRRLGAGLVLTAGLPAGVEYSDFALRPAFLALLDQMLAEAEQRRGPGTTRAGERWTFAPTQQIRITGPAGPVELSREECERASAGEPSPCADDGRSSAVVALAGSYELELDGERSTRVAFVPAQEITDPPGAAPPLTQNHAGLGGSGEIDASPELALVLLCLFAGELAVRVGTEARRRRRAARALS
jgi:VWA domain-containing protein/aerotolerance regulator-like protein